MLHGLMETHLQQTMNLGKTSRREKPCPKGPADKTSFITRSASVRANHKGRSDELGISTRLAPPIDASVCATVLAASFESLMSGRLGRQNNISLMQPQRNAQRPVHDHFPQPKK